jgi:predicted nuclease of predicted toxin-antitoxin system
MNFLADESVDRQIVVALRQKGYIVGYVAEMAPGISDDSVLDLANKEGALLLTADKDFGELVFRLRRLSSGVVLIRLAGLSPDKKAEITVAFIIKYLKQLTGIFSVITPTGIRIRQQRILTENP